MLVRKGIFQLIACIVFLTMVTAPVFVFADTKKDIQAAIDAKNKEIQDLEQQISQYQNQVDYYSGKANTLNGEVSSLKSSEKALSTSIKSTNSKIQKTNYTIQKNISQISTLVNNISDNRDAIGETLRRVNERDTRDTVELFLQRNATLSSFLRDYQDMSSIQDRLRGSVRVMQDQSVQLANAQQDLAARKDELQKLSNQLGDQKQIITVQRKEKDAVLSATKNKESEYQKMVADLQARRAQNDAEIQDYESKLKFSINSKSLPPTGTGALAWPIESVVITQRFGKTVDAKRLYVSGSHSGVDFRAPVGTPVYAAADGTVEGVGDTDKTCPRASFGKWVFIRHNNGLSTAYGHLSLIKATAGQVVKKGDLIAYSGRTGHATGPHLHLTVYASNGVNGEEGARIAERPSTACGGKTYTMPLAPTNAYLDPLLYLPTSGATYKDSGVTSSE